MLKNFIQKQDGQYGKIDNLNITLDGNLVVGVEDDAAPLLYKGALDFTVSTESGTEYTYDGDGRLTGDRNRGIAKIDYDAAGNPRRVQYMDGSVTEYVYTAAGEKLRAVHRTAAPNVSVAFGQTKELTASETLSVDSTDYYGSLTAENGEAKIYNFGGGYCTFDGTCKFHYFDRDHQGNVRAVVSTAGTIEQILNYYPFGAPYCDNTTLNPDLQPYKYNGKEFETMHGRNAYDYGARFYDPLLPTWDRMDPLCEKYYHISPYAYCANDPVNFIDLEGEEVINAFDQNDESVKIATKVFIDKVNDLDNAIIIFAHGSEYGIHLIYKDYDKVVTNVSDFEDFLSNYSETWSSRYLTGKDVSIVLFSCETGKNYNTKSFAERLSTELTDTPIIAPSSDVWIYSNGTSKIDKSGHWNKFVNGDIVNMFSGNLLPGTFEFDNTSVWDKININLIDFDEIWDLNDEF